VVRVLTRAFGRTTTLVWKERVYSEAPRTLSSRGRNESSRAIFQAGPPRYSMWEEGRADTHSGCQRWVTQYILSTSCHCTFDRHGNSRENQRTDSLASILEMRAGSTSMTPPDIVLLFGPLYHLVRKKERLKALAEAHRVLKPGGLLFAAAISRFTSALDGSLRGFIRDPGFMKIIIQDLKNGQHRNPSNKPEYFTTSF